MTHYPALDIVVAASEGAPPHSDQRALLDKAAAMLVHLREQAESDATPERVRLKILAFEQSFASTAERVGDRITHPVFLLNAMGEAMGRSRLISQPVVSFLQVGLYFFGLEQIERRWPAMATVYSCLHADQLATTLSRDGLKALLEAAAERESQGRPFCLSWHYLNGLRRAYFAHCRESEDALDHAQSGDLLERIEAVEEPGHATPAEFLLHIFRDELSVEQRWLYLAKNRSALADEGQRTALQALLAEFGEAPPDCDLGWNEISARLGMNEKSAKREYLRTLHQILRAAAGRAYGQGIVRNAFVRRILEALAAAIREKDLRLKDHNTGRGMPVLVEKWQVALRFVLSQERVSA